MKRLFVLAALLIVYANASLTLGVGDVQFSPEDIIRRAIDARGGQENLSKYLSHRVRAKGTIIDGDKSVSADFLYLLRSNPKSYKSVCEIKSPSIRLVTVFNGKSVWQNRNGITVDGKDDDLRDVKLLVYRSDVSNLSHSLLDKAIFNLTLLPKKRIKEKEAFAVRVSCKGYPDMDLYFDVTTFLLIKYEFRSKVKTGEDLFHEEFLEQYKEFKVGILFPTKKTIIEGGKKRFELELVDIEPLTDARDSDFAKP